MKIATPVKKFREAFTVVGRVVPTRSPKPILQSVKMVATAEGVTLLGTDLDIGIRHTIAGVTVYDPGEVLLPKDLTDRILKSADDDIVTIELDGPHLKVKCGRAKWAFATEAASLFPSPLEFPADASFTLAASDVKLLVDRTSYATDTNTTRYALGGMLVECDGPRVKFVALDGRRLATQVVPAEIDPGRPSDRTYVIPKRFADMLAGLCKDGEATVDFAFTSQYVVARVGGTVLGSRLVEGRFPRYRDAFPNEADTAKIGPIAADAFARAVEQAAATTSEDSRGIDLDFRDGVVTMRSRAESGTSEVEFAAAWDGDSTGFTVDPRYLADTLKSFGDESFSFGIIDHKNAVAISTESGFEGCVMPLTRDR